MCGVRSLRENLPNRVYHLISRVAHRAYFSECSASRTYFTLRYLSPLAAGGYIAPVDKDNISSSRRAYKLTRKGEEAMK